MKRTMCRSILALTLLMFSSLSLADDGSKYVTQVVKSGHWQSVQFAGAEQLVFRVASRSTNQPAVTITFTFAPSTKCTPQPAVMNDDIGSFDKNFDNGFLPMMYKEPGEKPVPDVVRTRMAQNGYAFFAFTRLNVADLLRHHDEGSLAVWVPGSHDGVVKRSRNIYFDLDGLSAAYKRAMSGCHDNE